MKKNKKISFEEALRELELISEDVEKISIRLMNQLMHLKEVLNYQNFA